VTKARGSHGLQLPHAASKLFGVSLPTIQKARVVWTYDDYRLMPDDGLRYEVIDGDLVVTPSPTTTHQKVSKRIQLALMLQIEERGLGQVFNAPVDLIFSKTRTLQPDLLVVRTERSNFITERGIETAPDLVIEILSPSTERTDRDRKSKLYAEEGVREFWIVDSVNRSFEVYELGAASYTLAGRYGPGTKVVSNVFDIDLDVDRVFRA